MILKQRFAEGKTQFIDIGSNFLIVTKASAEYDSVSDRHFNGDKVWRKDVYAFIEYGEKGDIEPLFDDFLQWIYSNDGQLFLTLTKK